MQSQVLQRLSKSVLLASLEQMRSTLAQAIVTAVSEKDMRKAIAYVRDLDTVHRLIWKVEQDVKNGKEVR